MPGAVGDGSCPVSGSVPRNLQIAVPAGRVLTMRTGWPSGASVPPGLTDADKTETSASARQRVCAGLWAVEGHRCLRRLTPRTRMMPTPRTTRWAPLRVTAHQPGTSSPSPARLRDFDDHLPSYMYRASPCLRELLVRVLGPEAATQLPET